MAIPVQVCHKPTLRPCTEVALGFFAATFGGRAGVASGAAGSTAAAGPRRSFVESKFVVGRAYKLQGLHKSTDCCHCNRWQKVFACASRTLHQGPVTHEGSRGKMIVDSCRFDAAEHCAEVVMAALVARHGTTYLRPGRSFEEATGKGFSRSSSACTSEGVLQFFLLAACRFWQARDQEFTG